MHIDAKTQIAGAPAIKVRDFLRWLGDGLCTGDTIARRLGSPDACAEELVAELLRLGYIEPVEAPGGRQRYRRTLAGSALAQASATRPLTRKTAELKLAEFLERVRAVNANQDLAYWVRKVLVFGSYLSEQERINDIDVAVELVERETDPDKRMAVAEARAQEARKAGRYLGSVDALCWPYQEVLLLLKGRSRAISLHPTDDAILKRTQSQVVFQVEEGSGTVALE